LLLTSQGVPILLQGDEFGATKSAAADQEGARNSYNYEADPPDPAIDQVNLVDWRLLDGNNSLSPKGPTYGPELFAWTRDLIALRKTWSHFRRTEFASYVADIPDGPGNDGRYTYAWEGPAAGAPSQIAVVWWGTTPAEPDLMLIYNESPEPFTVTNLGDWSHGNWHVLARSWFGPGADTCAPAAWESSCPEAGAKIEIQGRSMAILVSDND
jgi:pullulanase/glycogen debranching enzyme